jgi:N-methylhydantoinase B
MSGQFDAVSLGILWDRLISISNEIEQTLARTSFSTIVRESWDLASILFDERGRTLAQGTYSMPTFIGTAPQTIQHMLRRYPVETLAEGDVLFTNNSWMGTGHNFDVNVMRPAFRHGRIVGFAFSISHLPDIGGRGFSALNASMYEEGLQIPVTKLVRAGKINDELIELVRTNVRVPEQVVGDLMANVTATETGCRKLVEFLDEYGLESLSGLSDAIIRQSEGAMRKQIALLPAGHYPGSMMMEGLEQAVKMVCDIKVAGDRLSIDFTGSDPQTAAAFNVPVCYTRAMAAYAFKVMLLPHVPNNVGSVDPIEVFAPEGSIVNALPPAATAARHLVGHNIPPMIYTALADVLPEYVQANPAFTNILNISGRNRTGEDYATLFFTAGGLGGMSRLDGRSTTPSPSNMRVLSTEILENLTSLLVEHRMIRPDSGGPGEYRGGLGQTYRLRNVTDKAINVVGLGRRNTFPALGLRGGKPGAPRLYRINGEEVFPRGRYQLKPGDTIDVFDAGGGGYGNPSDRDRSAVAADVAAGFVTAAQAAADYGLAIVGPGQAKP